MKSKELLKIYQTICTWYNNFNILISSGNQLLILLSLFSLYYENYTFIHKTLDNRCRPLKWFGQNCTTELANIQQVCTRVLQIKIVLLCKYFLQGSWWKCSVIFPNQFPFIQSEMFKCKLQAASANAKISQTKQLPGFDAGYRSI